MKYIHTLVILFLIIVLAGCGGPDATENTESIKGDTLKENNLIPESGKQEKIPVETIKEDRGAHHKTGYDKIFKSKSGNATSVLKLRGPGPNGELGFFISVHSGKCTGQLTGVATKAKGTSAKYLYKESNCRLEIELKNDRAEVTQYGCRKHIGMLCGFSGTYKR